MVDTLANQAMAPSQSACPHSPERRATFSPADEVHESEGEPRLAPHPNPPTSPHSPERRATFSPQRRSQEIRGRAPTSYTLA
jgi:hypothetical protein